MSHWLPSQSLCVFLSKSVIGHNKNATIAMIDVGVRRLWNLMQFSVNMAHKYYLKAVLPMLMFIIQYLR